MGKLALSLFIWLNRYMSYDYFIAARYRNKEQALELAKRIRSIDKSVYCFVESEASKEHVGSVEADGEAAMAEFESIENWRTDAAVREIFETDMAALRASDTVVVLLPVGNSGNVEAGVSYGLGKRTIAIGEQKEAESLYLIFEEIYPDIDSFIEAERKS